MWPYISLRLNFFLIPTHNTLSLHLYAHGFPLAPHLNTLYSPTQHLIRYQIITFVNGLRDFDYDDPRRSISGATDGRDQYCK